MRLMLVLGLAALVGVVTLSSVGFARIMAPAPIHQRVALADCVVVGKVTAVEEKTVAGKKLDTTEYHVAVVKIDEALYSAKDLTHIKVGFLPQMGRARFPHLKLEVGQEACFFLQPHPELDLRITPMYFQVVDRKTNPEFKKEVELARRCGKLLADPIAALKAKEAEDRFLTAAMLVERYRTPRPVGGEESKQEPIDAEASRLILQVLAEADWTKTRAEFRGLSPQMVFLRLGLTPEDGWTPPGDVRMLPEAAKKWLKDNAATYRIKSYVAPKVERNK
jgi:hypothetical protein